MKYAYRILLLSLLFLPFVWSCNEDEDEVTGGAGEKTEEVFAENGKVATLQTATAGNGVNLVLMGDGFTLADVKSGRYAEVMEKSVDALFSTQPIKALKSYFNIYTVQMISVSDQMDGHTVFGAVTDGDLIRGVPNFDALDSKTLHYAAKAPGFGPDNTFVCVVMNTDLSGGITSYNAYKKEIPCAYCSLYGGLGSDEFNQTMTHELVGHGIAKLGDEYQPRDGYYDAEYVSEFKRAVKKYDWYSNYTFDPTVIPWSDFLTDYAGENLLSEDVDSDYYLVSDDGEGAVVYCPSTNSIMKDTSTPGMTFNAPGRYAVYKWVMKIATGTTPSYDDFVAFDKAHQ